MSTSWLHLGRSGGKRPASAEKLLSKEEAEEILDPDNARMVAQKVLEKAAFADMSARDPQIWMERARACIHEGRFDTRLAQLDYGIFALNKFLGLSGRRDTELACAAAEVMAEMIEEWRMWKPIWQMQMIIHMEDLDELNLRDCTWLFRIQGYRECVDIADTRIGSAWVGGKSWKVAAVVLLKAKSLAALGRSGDASQACEAIYTRRPLDPSSCLMAGDMLLGELHSYEQAVKCYQAVVDELTKTKDNAESLAKARHNQALAYLGEGQSEKARAVLQTCVKEAPNGSPAAQDSQHILDVLSGRARPDRAGAGVQFKVA
jgi:tetratricopeptide (TPR) repeat protein